MTDSPPAIDVPAEDIHEEPAEPMPEQPSTAVALVEPRAGAMISAEDPREILTKAKAIAEPLKELIESAGLAKALNRSQPDKKHVEVGGWQAAGTMLGALGGQPLHAETVWTRPLHDPATGDLIRHRYTAEVKRYHSKNNGGGLREVVTYEVDGHDWEACVEVKTPSGVVVGRAEAMVSRGEETWNTRDDYALRSMAETRAESRAWRKACGWIVHLAGYNPTPAEEMGHTPGADAPRPDAPAELPAWAREATTPRKNELVDVLGKLGVTPDEAKGIGKAMAQGIGHVPECVVGFAVGIVQTLEQRIADEKTKDKTPAERAEGARAAAVAAHATGTTTASTPGADPPGRDAGSEGPETAARSAAASASPEPSSEGGADQPPAGAQGTLAGTPAGSVEPPALSGAPAQDVKALRAAGCICSSPLEAITVEHVRDAGCPIKGHGIPF